MDMPETFSVLIVEDEADLCELWSDFLEILSGERGAFLVPEYTQSGKEGLELLKSQAYDLVILDLNLPDLHGTEVLKQKKETELNRNTPTIVLSGRIKEHSWDTSELVQYIEKPISRERFNRLVTISLEMRKVFEQRQQASA